MYRLSDSGAKARCFHEVSDAHLTCIVQVALKSELFTYAIDEAAQARAQLMAALLRTCAAGSALVSACCARRVGAVRILAMAAARWVFFN